jgi:CRP-like cAMP-binding protein
MTLHASLRRAAIVHGVEPAAARDLTRRLQRADFPRGHVIFTEGQPGDRLYIILSGMVKITCGAANGRQAVLAIMGPSDMFGELSVFDPGPRSSSAITLTKVRAVTIDRLALRAWSADRPQIRDQLLTVLARRLRRTQDDLCDLIDSDVTVRVAKHLLALGRRFGRPDGDRLVVRDLTQDDVAGLVGSTKGSVSRALHELTQRGCIRMQAKTLVIIDADRLASHALQTG